MQNILAQSDHNVCGCRQLLFARERGGILPQAKACEHALLRKPWMACLHLLWYVPTSAPMRVSFMSCSSRATGWRRCVPDSLRRWYILMTASTEGTVAYNQAGNRIIPVFSHLVGTPRPGFMRASSKYSCLGKSGLLYDHVAFAYLSKRCSKA